MKYGFSITEMKEILECSSTMELRDEYRLYCTLQSRGIKDEVVLSLIEQEMTKRGINVEEFNSDFLA